MIGSSAYPINPQWRLHLSLPRLFMSASWQRAQRVLLCQVKRSFAGSNYVGRSRHYLQTGTHQRQCSGKWHVAVSFSGKAWVAASSHVSLDKVRVSTSLLSATTMIPSRSTHLHDPDKIPFPIDPILSGKGEQRESVTSQAGIPSCTRNHGACSGQRWHLLRKSNPKSDSKANTDTQKSFARCSGDDWLASRAKG